MWRAHAYLVHARKKKQPNLRHVNEKWRGAVSSKVSSHTLAQDEK